MDFSKPPPDNSAHIISTPIITPTLTTRVQLPMPRDTPRTYEENIDYYIAKRLRVC